MSFNLRNSGGWKDVSEEGIYSILNIGWKFPPCQAMEEKKTKEKWQGEDSQHQRTAF